MVLCDCTVHIIKRYPTCIMLSAHALNDYMHCDMFWRSSNTHRYHHVCSLGKRRGAHQARVILYHKAVYLAMPWFIPVCPCLNIATCFGAIVVPLLVYIFVVTNTRGLHLDVLHKLCRKLSKFICFCNSNFERTGWQYFDFGNYICSNGIGRYMNDFDFFLPYHLF